MHYDEILQEIGTFGAYQKRLFFLLSLPCMTAGAYVLNVFAILGTPKHRCKIPSIDNDTFAVQGPSHERLISDVIPVSNDPSLLYDKCHIWTQTNESDVIGNASALVKCNDWVYEKTDFLNSFTSDNNLVCDAALVTSHIQMFLFFGFLVGATVLGQLSDRFGRKKVLCAALTMSLVVGVVVVFSPGPYVFAFFQFLIGGTTHGAFLVLAVYDMEIVGPTKRLWTGMLIQVFFAIGLCYVALIAFLIKSWRWICLATSLPTVIYLIFWWVIPESPRWLISKGRKRDALQIIQKTAKVNKKQPIYSVNQIADVSKAHTDGKLWHILHSPVLLRRTSVLAFNWMVVSMTYYGVTLNSGNMGGNFYLNFFLMGIVEVPGIFLGMLLMHRFGRRWSNSGTMVMAGLACLSTIPTALIGGEGLEGVVITLALVGKALSAAAFAIVYMFTAELLPTVVRNASMGACSCCARIGGMIAPYVAKSGELIGGQFGKVEPLIVFGVLSVIAGVLLLTLPETINKQLPDTIEDGEHFGKKTSSRDQELDVPFVSEKE